MERFINPRKLIEEERLRLKTEQDKKRKHRPRPNPSATFSSSSSDTRRSSPGSRISSRIVRDEAYYFAPQGMTKVMNEGWATYWHSTMMTKHYLDASEVIDYADHHSGTVHMPAGEFNPYKIGVEIFRDIEDRWNRGRFGKEYEELDTLGGRDRWEKPDSTQGAQKSSKSAASTTTSTSSTNSSPKKWSTASSSINTAAIPHTGQMPHRQPRLQADQGIPALSPDQHGPAVHLRGRCQLPKRRRTLSGPASTTAWTWKSNTPWRRLKSVQAVWGRPVHLQARIDDDMMLFSFDGKQSQQQKIHGDIPKPAHEV